MTCSQTIVLYDVNQLNARNVKNTRFLNLKCWYLDYEIIIEVNPTILLISPEILPTRRNNILFLKFKGGNYVTESGKWEAISTPGRC